MAMQDVINKMKGTALGVAEYLTPVLKVDHVHSSSDVWYESLKAVPDVNGSMLCYFSSCIFRNQSFRKLGL